ncbi:MAG: glycosyltransferase family 4 protein [Brevinema sp.]
MKILALNWRDPLHPEAGGAEVHLDKVLSHLAQHHEVRLISTRVPDEEFSYVRNGYLVERAGHPFFFHYFFKRQWKNHYSKLGYDLVIDDVSKIGLGTPRYIHSVPVMAIFHHIHGNTLFSLLPFPLATYVYHAERHALKYYLKTPMIVVSPSTKDELMRLGNYQDLRVIPNGIDDEFFMQAPKTKNLLCYVGRITKAKGIHYSLLAFAKILKKFPDARFVIAGKGKESDHLHALATDLGIFSSVEFRGFITEQEKISLYKESTAVLFTSEKEGWGITAIEASACSTPVFGFDVPGVRDSVQNGVNGYLVPFEDIDALADKVCWYLNDESAQQSLPQTAQNFAKDLSWKKITSDFEAEMLSIYQNFHQKSP